MKSGNINSAIITNGIITSGIVDKGESTDGGKMIIANVTQVDIQGAELNTASIDEIKVKSK